MDNFPQFPIEDQDGILDSSVDLNQEDLGQTNGQTPQLKQLNPKILAGFLIGVSCVGLFFAVFNWFNSLKIPFATQEITENLNSSLPSTNSDVANVLALRNQDTDLDGLSDYDELYVYKTSPYITDTDSDGLSDGEEVKNNTDPNCPIGLVCNKAAEVNSNINQTNANALPASADALSVDQIKSLLLQAGATESQLQGIDDATLRQIYQETLQQSASSQGSVVTPPTQALNQNVNAADLQLNSYTPAQIRQLLKDNGATDADLQGLSDSDLLNLWQQVTVEQSQNTNQ